MLAAWRDLFGRQKSSGLSWGRQIGVCVCVCVCVYVCCNMGLLPSFVGK